MVRIKIDHAFPVSVDKAFSYITDIDNWSQYWPDFIRLEEHGDIKWGARGAQLLVVIHLLNRETGLNIELHSFVKDRLVKYVSRQKGLPEIWHERHFMQTSKGSGFRLIMEYQPRRGLAGLFDRILLRYSIKKAIRKTLNNLDLQLGYRIPAY